MPSRYLLRPELLSGGESRRAHHRLRLIARGGLLAREKQVQPTQSLSSSSFQPPCREASRRFQRRASEALFGAHQLSLGSFRAQLHHSPGVKPFMKPSQSPINPNRRTSPQTLPPDSSGLAQKKKKGFVLWEKLQGFESSWMLSQRKGLAVFG